MRRAKIFAAVIYAVLVMGTIAFVHFPELQADEAQAKIGPEQALKIAGHRGGCPAVSFFAGGGIV